MEPHPPHTGARTPVEVFHFGCNDEEIKFVEIQKHLETMNKIVDCHSSEIILRLGNEQLVVDTTVLGALSDYWRKSLQISDQESQRIYTISVDLPSTVRYLPVLKTLLYVGKVTLSGVTLEGLMAIVKDLKLEYTEFILSGNATDKFLIWQDHSQQMISGLQQMCANQQCTDFNIFVDSYMIQAHRFVLGAYSSVLAKAFQQNPKCRTLHLPNISLKSAQSLLSYMYYGKGTINSLLIEEFHKLCLSLKVVNLAKSTQGYCSNIAVQDKSSESKINVFTTVEPEVALILRKLQMLFDVQGKTDLTLLVGSRRIDTHKSLMGISCPSIHTALMEETKDEPSMIFVSDADYKSMACLITLIYNGACYMSSSQIEVATSYLDAKLFQVRVTDDASLSPINPVPSSSDSNKETSKTLPRKRKVSFLKGGKIATNINSKGSTKRAVSQKFDSSRDLFKPIQDQYSESDLDHHTKYNHAAKNQDSHQSPATLRNFHPQQEESSARPLAGKRRKKSKLYSCDEWVTNTSQIDTILDQSEKDEKSPLKCDECSITFSRKIDFQKHSSTHLGKFTDHLICKICGDLVARRVMYSHMKSHENNLRCGCCERRFRLKSRLFQHLRKEHMLRETDREAKQLNHTEDQEIQPDSYSCEDCSGNFRYLEQLKKHRCKRKGGYRKRKWVDQQYQTSPEELSPKGSSIVPAEFECDQCSYRCLNYNLLIKHTDQFHEGKRKMATFIRKKQFSPYKKSADNLYYTCSHCTYRCFDYPALLEHVDAVHTRASKLQDISTIEHQNDLSVNQQSVASEGPNVTDCPEATGDSFACPECGTYFKDLDSFSAHAEKEGHGGLVGSCWICGICKNAFFEESQLNEHLASHNPLPGHLLHSEDNEKQEFTTLDHATPGNLDFSSEEDFSGALTKGKNDTVEADSSVLDSNVAEVDQESRLDSPSDLNLVTSSVSNERLSYEGTASSPISNLNQIEKLCLDSG